MVAHIFFLVAIGMLMSSSTLGVAISTLSEVRNFSVILVMVY